MPYSVCNHSEQSETGAALPVKLLRYALDPSCGDREAEDAAALFVQAARREGVTFDGLASLISPTPAAEETPAAAEVVVHFGKYAGMTLGEIAAVDLEYVDWLRRECIKRTIKRAARVVVRWVTSAKGAA